MSDLTSKETTYYKCIAQTRAPFADRPELKTTMYAMFDCSREGIPLTQRSRWHEAPDTIDTLIALTLASDRQDETPSARWTPEDAQQVNS